MPREAPSFLGFAHIKVFFKVLLNVLIKVHVKVLINVSLKDPIKVYLNSRCRSVAQTT